MYRLRLILNINNLSYHQPKNESYTFKRAGGVIYRACRYAITHVISSAVVAGQQQAFHGLHRHHIHQRENDGQQLCALERAGSRGNKVHRQHGKGHRNQIEKGENDFNISCSFWREKRMIKGTRHTAPLDRTIWNRHGRQRSVWIGDQRSRT